MPNKRDLRLDSYGIDREAYRELYHFCLQYPKKKRRLADLHNPLQGMNYDGMPHGTSPGEPTAAAAERAAVLSRDCEMIEQAAKEADPINAYYLLRAIAYDENWYYLRAVCGLNLGEKNFRTARRRFYYILAQKKGMT
jgi:hypothetical protein